jgi:crotonobetainyl-CoA:carnitine CoA-transferase CaiB-like acyl-CoA transferase
VLRDEHWIKFCAAMELGDLAADPRFTTNALRLEHRDALDDIIVPMLASQPSVRWLERLRAADILCGPINDFTDIVADPNLSAALPFVDTMAPNVPQAVGIPIRLDGQYAETTRRAPAKGEHTREILAEFGYAAAEIQMFFNEGAVFAVPLEENTE